MYNENDFLSYITGLKVRRVFFMIIYSIVGAIVGIISSDFLINTLLLNNFFRIIIIAVCTLLFFGLSLILTANTSRDIQEGYWKIALLRKLTVISKKLDGLEKTDLQTVKNEISEIIKPEKENIEE